MWKFSCEIDLFLYFIKNFVKFQFHEIFVKYRNKSISRKFPHFVSCLFTFFTDEDDESEERRAITYQIAKNKGLQPKRSKLNRNPRVKHRVKFQKAKVRRKGQVREVRTEVKKYGGEMSGINARVKKGVKLS